MLQKCTLACVHCSAESSPGATRALESALILKLLNEGKELGLESVIFTGGEPLIEPNLRMYVSAAKELGLKITIFTAGFLPKLLDGDIDRFITELCKVGLSQLNVSIYSMSAERNAAITRKRESLDYSLKTLIAGTRNGITTEIHFVPMAPNQNDLEPVAQWASNNRITRLSILKYVPQGRAGLAIDTLAPAPSDEFSLRPRIEALRKLYPELKIYVGPSFGFLGLSEPRPCSSGFQSLSIRSDGLIFPCDAFKGVDDQFFLKDGVNRMDIRYHSLKEIWNSCPYLKATRAFILANTPNDSLRCANGCVSRSVYKGIL